MAHGDDPRAEEALHGHYFVPTTRLKQYHGDPCEHEPCGFIKSNGRECGWPQDEHAANEAALLYAKRQGWE